MNAYEAGFDCGKNGANMMNCNFSIFSSKEETRAWEAGKHAAECVKKPLSSAATRGRENMKLKITQKKSRSASITKTRSGRGWKISVTGRASFVDDLIGRYVPELKRLAKMSEAAATEEEQSGVSDKGSV